jgi:hypothetical protein
MQHNAATAVTQLREELTAVDFFFISRFWVAQRFQRCDKCSFERGISR